MTSHDAPAAQLPAPKISRALIEALFPAGKILPASKAEDIATEVLALLDRVPGTDKGLSSLLHWLEWRCFFSTGSRFSKADVATQEKFLTKISPSLISGSLLRVTTIAFKLAYLRNPINTDLLNCSNRVEVPKQIESHRWQQQISKASDFESDEELEVDVVIIGTGAGGAAAAYELAGKGLAVVMIEEGQYFTRQDFTGDHLEMGLKLYRSAPLTVGNTVMPVPIGKTVGGTTTVNSGTAMRTPDEVLEEWQQNGLSEFSKEELEPYFQIVEEVINVESAETKFVGELANVVKAGAESLGMTGTHTLPRNAKACDGQALCIFGCPTDAKQSTNVSFVPRALDSGAFLFSEFQATELIKNGKQIEGVIAIGTGSEGKPVKLCIKAAKTIVSMGTFMTPGFLQRNGVKQAHIGRHLTVHPAASVFGYYPDRNFNNAATIPQGYGVMGMKNQGITFEGGTLPFFAHGLISPYAGQDFVDFAERYQETGYFSFMIKETSEGTVRNSLIRNMPFTTYFINKHDQNLVKIGIEKVARIHFRAGAKIVYVPSLTGVTELHTEADLDAFLNKNLKPRDFALMPFHPLGTARIAANPTKGACDSNHKVFGWDNLYVMDGSSVPSSLGANPQVTIMALATRAARALAKELND